ncbi:D-glucuronyl C5-epimerase family protein [Paraconexibacter antarcticus]|uniref:D-glucuronyl C5-epimerase family protein n=1 Tax=Paraconexibacter antarcticus TaxID=2949664 RepID=A0ABY5DVN2_9ACTN|nr:D-glucuronyl C5-epimerase family protein [Paraconexibacter antarcticus]UTI64599.1 D-glucuronyl C5-epimerase family protein [Paraconexibacter antarcticus]
MSRRRPLTPVLLAAALLAGGSAAAAVASVPAEPPPSAGVSLTALPFLADLPAAVAGTVAQTQADAVAAAAAAARRAEARRRAEAARLQRSPTPEAVLRRAWLLHLESREVYDAQRAILSRARLAARTLGGGRGAEQRAAVAVVDGLAAARILTADRLPAVLLTLQRNTDWWTRRGAPPYGRSIVRGNDPVTLRYVPGQGLVLHELGSWGRVNWLAGACLRDRVHCPRRRLATSIERLMALAVRRDGVVRAESYFSFGGARAPWISGMTQGTLIQALTRASVVLGSAPDRRRAKAALGAFSRPAPAGVAVPDAGGRLYVMYSSNPGLHVLNGHLQALTGLRDLATLGGSARAATLFRRGERAARVELRRTDTGAWSRYSAGGAESTVSYHRLVTGFLANLCARGAGRRYCAASVRFRRYLTQPTAVVVRAAARPRSQRATSILVWISKVSTVRLAVRDVRGRVVLWRTAVLPRGAHRFAWAAPHHGRYRIRVTALGPGSPPAGTGVATVRVLPTHLRMKHPRPKTTGKGR